MAKRRVLQRMWRALGPGLTTGAADDDPSGIATYSQAGAQFGFESGIECEHFRTGRRLVRGVRSRHESDYDLYHGRSRRGRRGPLGVGAPVIGALFVVAA